MKSMRILLIITIVFSFLFVSCSTGYENDGDAVYYEHWNEGSGQHKKILDANPKTFKVLEFNNYAKDDKFVFYQGVKIIGADAKTFEAIDEFYAKDKNYGWYGSDIIKTSNGKTFKVINSYFSTDGNDVFYTTEPLNMIEPKNFKIVEGENNNDTWTTDGKYYYYNQYKVPSDDYYNLTIYPKSGGISNDKNWVYFLDHKLNYNIEGKKM
jgi:hypothetical protein